ncbi:MAG TPA: lactate utilization protein C [Mycobacteriales bacterium]|nr:lactate utilization protein C [Mycobacteriales bacterium]
MSSPARTEVLARIRSALGPDPQPEVVPRDYRSAGEHPPGDPVLLDLLADRLVDYRAGVRRCTPAELPGVLADVLATRAPQGRLVVPPGLPAQWTAGRDVLRDDGSATTAQLDEVAGVVTGCAVAVAETGTLVLDAGPEQGRRALTLVPDLHVCVVRAEQVVQTVPEALRRLEPTRPLTWISGPSATSDIELNRVEGVHGPRTLEVVLVQP